MQWQELPPHQAPATPTRATSGEPPPRTPHEPSGAAPEGEQSGDDCEGVGGRELATPARAGGGEAAPRGPDGAARSPGAQSTPLPYILGGQTPSSGASSPGEDGGGGDSRAPPSGGATLEEALARSGCRLSNEAPPSDELLEEERWRLYDRSVAFCSEERGWQVGRLIAARTDGCNFTAIYAAEGHGAWHEQHALTSHAYGGCAHGCWLLLEGQLAPPIEDAGGDRLLQVRGAWRRRADLPYHTDAEVKTARRRATLEAKRVEKRQLEALAGARHAAAEAETAAALEERMLQAAAELAVRHAATGLNRRGAVVRDVGRITGTDADTLHGAREQLLAKYDAAFAHETARLQRRALDGDARPGGTGGGPGSGDGGGGGGGGDRPGAGSASEGGGGARGGGGAADDSGSSGGSDLEWSGGGGRTRREGAPPESGDSSAGTSSEEGGSATESELSENSDDAARGKARDATGPRRGAQPAAGLDDDGAGRRATGGGPRATQTNLTSAVRLMDDDVIVALINVGQTGLLFNGACCSEEASELLDLIEAWLLVAEPDVVGLVEVKGSFASMGRLASWAKRLGYDARYVPGSSKAAAERAADGGAASSGRALPTGGVVMIWRESRARLQPDARVETRVCKDAVALIIPLLLPGGRAATFEPTYIPPGEGRGRVQLLDALHGAGKGDRVAFGDFNARPSTGFSANGAALAASERRFRQFCGRGGAGDEGRVFGELVELPLPPGTFTRLDYSETRLGGVERGTSTISHAVVSGEGAARWRGALAAPLFNNAGRLATDHKLVVWRWEAGGDGGASGGRQRPRAVRRVGASARARIGDIWDEARPRLEALKTAGASPTELLDELRNISLDGKAAAIEGGRQPVAGRDSSQKGALRYQHRDAAALLTFATRAVAKGGVSGEAARPEFDARVRGPLTRPMAGLLDLLARGDVVGQRRMEVEVLAELAKRTAYLKKQLRRQERREAASFVRDMGEAASLQDVQRRWQKVCAWLRPPRASAAMDAFREGDSAEGRLIAHPGSAVLQAGADILRVACAGNVRPAAKECAGAWLELVTPVFEEVRGPDGGVWDVGRATTFTQFQAMLRRGRGKALGIDESQCELWLAAPEWAQRELYCTLIEMARAALTARGWKRMYILLILKKKHSDLVSKRRDISVTSQELKLVEGLLSGGYKATQVRRAQQQTGWSEAKGPKDTAFQFGLLMDAAHLLRSFAAFPFIDFSKFFPRCQHDLMKEAAVRKGVPKQVVAMTEAIFKDMLASYATSHGLTEEVPFTTCNQGAISSTERCAIYIDAMIEACNLACDGVWLYEGALTGGRRVTIGASADDVIGALRSWAAAAMFFRMADGYAEGHGHTLGIEGTSKCALLVIEFDCRGRLVTKERAPIVLGGGRRVPVLDPRTHYPHLGVRRRADGSHECEVKHVTALSSALLARAEPAKVAGSEWEAAMQGSIGGVFAYHGAGAAALADVGVAEQAAEKKKRREYRTKFHASAIPNYEFYASKGWVHAAAEAAASLHAQWTEMLALPFDCDLRRVARSQLALTLDQLGCRGDPLSFDFSHLIEVMGRKEQGRFWQCAKWLSILGRCLVAQERACVVGKWVGGPADRGGDVLDVASNARWRRDGDAEGDGHELFRGELLTTRAAAAGLQREPNVKLLRAGVSVVAHVCNVDTISFMNWKEARWTWPLLRDMSGGEQAWTKLIGELELMGVQPLPGRREESAEGCYKTAGGAHGGCVSDAAAVAPNGGERRYEELLQNLRQGGEPATRAQWEEAVRHAWFDGSRPRVRDPAEVNHFTATPEELHGGAKVVYRLAAKGLTRGAETPTAVLGGEARRGCEGGTDGLTPEEEAAIAEAEGMAGLEEGVETPTAAVLDGEAWRGCEGSTDGLTPEEEAAITEAEEMAGLEEVADARPGEGDDEAMEEEMLYGGGAAGAGRGRAASGTETERDALLVMEEGCQKWREGKKTEAVDEAMSKQFYADLRLRQLTQGWDYDAIASVDGGWQRDTGALTCGVVVAFGPRCRRAGTFQTLALRHETDDEEANNFDTELLARMVALETTSQAGAARVLVIFDATSPVVKSLKFRRQDVRARGRCACDEWLATAIALEDEHAEVHYEWLRSHTQSKMPGVACGAYLYNVVADALCGQAEGNAEADVATIPVREPRHRSMRFVARGAERRWLLVAYNGLIAAGMKGEGGGIIRAAENEFDCLASKEVPAGLRKSVLEARCGGSRLMGCERRWRGQVQAKRFRAAMCPCGGGPQTLTHVAFDCCLPAVQLRRQETAKEMRLAAVGPTCAEWWELVMALECNGTVTGTTRAERLTRAALGVMAPHPELKGKRSHASAARGTVSMLRAAEAASGETRLRIGAAAARAALARRVLTAWRAVAAARPGESRAAASEARRAQLTWLTSRMGGLGVGHARRLLAEAKLGAVAGALAARAKQKWAEAREQWDEAGARPDYAAALLRARLGAHFARLRLHSMLDSGAWRALRGTWTQLVRIGGMDASYLTDGEQRLRHACAARRAATKLAARKTATLQKAERQDARAARLRERRRRRNRTPAQAAAEKAEEAARRQEAAEERRRTKKREKAARTPIQRAERKQEEKLRREKRRRAEEREFERRVRATRAYEARTPAAGHTPDAGWPMRVRPAWATAEPRGGERGAATLPRKRQGQGTSDQRRKQVCLPAGLGRQGRLAAIAAATGAAGAMEAAARASRSAPARAVGGHKPPRGCGEALDAPT